MPKPKSTPKPLTDSVGEVRELTLTDLKAFQPVQSLSASLQSKVRTRGTQKAPTKERITIRLSRDVVERFRATGDGWQTRVDAALQDWLEEHDADVADALMTVRAASGERRHDKAFGVRS